MKLAIKGHPTRGEKVIELFEMLGGVNWHGFAGNRLDSAYYISDSKAILFDDTYDIVFEDGIKEFITFTLEEFLEKFPYKVGDKVHNIIHNENQTIANLSWDFNENEIVYLVDNNEWVYVNYIQPYKEETMENKLDLLQQLKDYFESTPREVIEKEWHKYDEYNEISPKVSEYLEYVNNIRQPKYPKTYEGCCEVLGIGSYFEPEIRNVTTEECHKFTKLMRLKRCRDAYWKIAGEQMGLGKPWEPDYTEESWEQGSPIKYVIYYTGTNITKERKCTPSYTLTFPTEEMRDAFYENFKELIEQCKELL